MKLGVFTPVYGALPRTAMLDRVAALGLDGLELAAGGYPGTAHADPAALLADPAQLEAFRRELAARNLQVLAVSVHGNPLHPDEDRARRDHDDYRRALELAARLNVETVVTFSGCPGGSPADRTPNWITATWPPEFLDALDWQWQERVLPYWSAESAHLRTLGLRVALELHPGFVAYNPATLLKLRAGTGDNVGVNFDPSHLYWQGIDPLVAIRELRGAIHHFHAKDTQLHRQNIERNGVLDLTPYDRISERSWTFRSVGSGHDELHWSRIMAELRLAGYDGAISIEHEDALMSVDEGLHRAVDTLQRVILREAPAQAWWLD
ncbi:sugar phosphate isomerase/epimerase family protein [Deinococcus maricopensis]|uniref:Xylose isomerase domain-containing protein TIM barrel n=1 Tax=Deinococcus maricopensis (strain DSM 21211 / LMG 22137 / NRRL B-23946 / LB-34) TaxID=709986 RepID=E8U3G8_DEIML|nr:sugar phosphate isomerase/epimerase [Deinococcus maricopensis]ADV65839.1 Xylose isomerase domain-containing protein TIM barrel [Deinococcus maricopensis DSM 21211]